MSTPIIYLAFANDRDDYLVNLKNESRGIRDKLSELDRKEYIRVNREESASSSDIFTDVAESEGRLAIFHYGGHANGTRLHLEGEGEGAAEGLAQLLGDQENLLLVFINGCSSKGQVQTLFDHGVKAVIATSVAINDDKATAFAIRFYESLAHRRTIEQAFNAATGLLRTDHSDKLQPHQRGVLKVWGDQQEPEELPWGLYIKEGHDEVRHAKLPYYREIGLPKDLIQYMGSSFTANRYIISVLDEMCKFNPDIYDQMTEMRDGKRVPIDSSRYPGIIIENFPWPIGSQILELIKNDAPDRTRVEHLLSTYIVTSMVLYYILLSDFWEARYKLKDASILWDHPHLAKTNWIDYDYLAQVKPLYDSLVKVKSPFVTEFEMLINAANDADSHFNKAHAYLEQQRALVSEGFPEEGLDKLCLKLEQAVRVILAQASFLANYRMLTVRNVSIDKPRFEPARYELDMGRLNAQQNVMLKLYQDRLRRLKTSYCDSSSVILTANEDRLGESLNLSPFIIDKNTFVRVKKSETTDQDRIAHIFILAWEEEGRLYYLSLNHSVYHAKETRSDQVHTDQTRADYLNGKNVKKESAEDEELDFFGEHDESDVHDDTRVFELLKQQFDMMNADLNP
ncbi:MAG: CHAT domain-containing protein [Saprospiraceae bacterium]|nr:CHAT domain-containing protein [Saprospiraceae bacterium]